MALTSTIKINDAALNMQFGGAMCNCCIFNKDCQQNISLTFLKHQSRAEEVTVKLEVTRCSYFVPIPKKEENSISIPKGMD